MVNSHGREFVSCDPDKCVDCQTCEYTCSITTEKVINPLKSPYEYYAKINWLTWQFMHAL